MDMTTMMMMEKIIDKIFYYILEIVKAINPSSAFFLFITVCVICIYKFKNDHAKVHEKYLADRAIADDKFRTEQAEIYKKYMKELALAEKLYAQDKDEINNKLKMVGLGFVTALLEALNNLNKTPRRRPL
jgi:hypothetical protein